MKATLKLITTAAMIGLFSVPAVAADIVIGVPNWPSVRVTANIMKVVIEENLGLDVELQSGTNPIIFEAMDSGAMHVHPEVWLPNQASLHDKFVKGKKTVKMNLNGIPAFNGYCVTEHTATTTGINGLSDLTDPEMAVKFDTDGDGKGEVWIGAAGWASTPIEKIRAKSYGFAETMKLKEMDETLALAEVDNAVAKKKPIVFMCYKPHHIFSLHKLVVLDEPKHHPSQWKVIQPTDDPQWLEKSSAGVAWGAVSLHVHFAKALETSHPAAAAVLSKIKLETDQLSEMTYALVVEKKDPAAYAKSWVAKHGSQVSEWLQ